MKLNSLIATKVKPIGGGGDDPKPLTPQQMREWNLLLDHIKAKGYEGSDKLDKDKSLSKALFDDFKKSNPNVSITYDIVPAVQSEMQKLKDSTQAFLQRRGDPNATKVMANVSKVDGFLGSKTSQFRFPEMKEAVYKNDNLVSNSNLGLVNSGLKPTGVMAVKKKLPVGAKLEKMQDGYYYQDDNGDLVKYE